MKRLGNEKPKQISTINLLKTLQSQKSKNLEDIPFYEYMEMVAG